MHEVFLPQQLSINSLEELISNVLDFENNPKSTEIAFNFNSLKFVKPAGITVFSNLIEWLKKNDVLVRFKYKVSDCYEVNQLNPLKYLDDSEFFQLYLKKKLFYYSAIRSSTIPLKKIFFKDYHWWFEGEVIPWLNSSLESDISRQMPEFKVCIDEIFNNINDHSGESIGCVFCQLYPRENRLHFSVSDFGYGIPATIKEKFSLINDSEAISKAVMEGYSTKSVPGNRGSGLDTLLKNIVCHNQGTLQVLSNKGRLDTRINGQPFIRDLSFYYPGTLINIILRTDNIPEYQDTEEDFSW